MRIMKAIFFVAAIFSLSFANISWNNYQQWKFIGDKKSKFSY